MSKLKLLFLLNLTLGSTNVFSSYHKIDEPKDVYSQSIPSHSLTIEQEEESFRFAVAESLKRVDQEEENRITQEKEEKEYQLAIAASLEEQDHQYAIKLQNEMEQQHEDLKHKDYLYACQLKEQLCQERKVPSKIEFSENVEPDFISSLQSEHYPKYDRIMGVNQLHKQGLRGRDINIGVLDVKLGCMRPDASKNKFETLLTGSTAFSEHSIKMALRISGLISNFNQFPSIAPKASLFHVVTNQWNHNTGDLASNKYYQTITAHFDSEGQQVKSKICNGKRSDGANVSKACILQDMTLDDVEADAELAKFFFDCIEKSCFLVNVSRDLLCGSQAEAALHQFACLGGLIVKAIGNDSVTWNSDGIFKRNSHEPLTISDYDIHLHKMIQSDLELKNAVLFVGALESDMLRVLDSSCMPSECIQSRTLFACGDVQLCGQRSSASGTSIAAATVTGIVALMKEAFPNKSFQEIANALLKTKEFLNDSFSSEAFERINVEKALALLRS